MNSYHSTCRSNKGIVCSLPVMKLDKAYQVEQNINSHHEKLENSTHYNKLYPHPFNKAKAAPVRLD